MGLARKIPCANASGAKPTETKAAEARRLFIVITVFCVVMFISFRVVRT